MTSYLLNQLLTNFLLIQGIQFIFFFLTHFSQLINLFYINVKYLALKFIVILKNIEVKKHNLLLRIIS